MLLVGWGIIFRFSVESFLIDLIFAISVAIIGLSFVGSDVWRISDDDGILRSKTKSDWLFPVGWHIFLRIDHYRYDVGIRKARVSLL